MTLVTVAEPTNISAEAFVVRTSHYVLRANCVCPSGFYMSEFEECYPVTTSIV